MALVEIGKTTDIPEGEARRFVVNGIEVAVANLGDGQFFAVEDTCSHAEASLSEGEVDPDDEIIECPRHGSVSWCRCMSSIRPSRASSIRR